MKKKIAKYGAFVLLGLVFLALVLLNLFWQDHWLDSDMAAEMIFSKLLSESGHIFATPEWYYSTEFRFLYTHLVMAPLFLASENWHLIRLITNVLSYALMLVAYFYMMKPLKADRRLTALTAILLLLPFSETMMTHMQMGNTYMPHVIICFFFLGMYLRLVRKEVYTKAGRWTLFCFFVILSLICGVSGVRYLLALQCPLVITAFVYVLDSTDFQLFREQFGRNENAAGYFRRVLKGEEIRYLYMALSGAVCSIVGYGINVLWVSRQYVFQTYGATNFIAVYQGVLWERLQNAIGSLLMLFGYIPDKGFLSLRGFISILAFVMLWIFGYCVIKARKKSTGQRLFMVLFVITAFVLNLFVFVFTTSTMVPRYYITVFIFALPALVFYMEQEEPVLDRFAVGMLLAFCLTLASAKITLSFISTDKNEGKRAVAAFLQENGYEFGYAGYWNANIVTELTDGRVEVANIMDPETLEYFKWSSPMKYYGEGYHEGEVFLLLSAEENEQYRDTEALKAGKQVYRDADYVVYGYESSEELFSKKQ
ncbi:MAG: hypothetical protein NC251_13400 [Lachnoclostridium sp.]|nr:hypothetical protein [Lachnospira sp.]MCM1249407.1 hypothetical protein [Lachnoclostridium sp.]